MPEEEDEEDDDDDDDEQQSEVEEEEEIQRESSLSEDELSISPLRGARDREVLARGKELQILIRHSEISNTSSSIINNISISSSSSLLQISSPSADIRVDPPLWQIPTPRDY